jgi:hypothetical protein
MAGLLLTPVKIDQVSDSDGHLVHTKYLETLAYLLATPQVLVDLASLFLPELVNLTTPPAPT